MTKIKTLAMTAIFTIATSSFASSMAMAQEITTMSVEEIETFLLNKRAESQFAMVDELCAIDTLALSDNAREYCNGNADFAPQPISDGSRFANRGTGAEFNFLIANIANLRG